MTAFAGLFGKTQLRLANPFGNLIELDGGRINQRGPRRRAQIGFRNEAVARPVRDVELGFDPAPPLHLKLATTSTTSPYNFAEPGDSQGQAPNTNSTVDLVTLP